MKKTFFLGSIILGILFSCNSNDNSSTIISNSQPNILFIIADDMGLDATPNYPIGSIKPYMPNLENMMSTGVRFNNFWANPTCTPTRASLLTGKYGFRTNMLKVGDILSTTETSIQQFLDNHNSGYNSAIIGKWHVGYDDNHPAQMGVNHYEGLISGGVQSYWNWNLTQNGVTTAQTEYSTTKFTDLAINWVAEQEQPWFLWLAYNAPHTPFHLAPETLHSQGSLPTDNASISANPIPYYMSALEAMDSEIGRLLSSLSTEEKDNTLIIFIGDNGTPNQVAQDYNSSRVKGTIYNGGINTPMVISGKNVSRYNATEDALVGTTDFFATIAEITGTGINEMNDSKSFMPLFTESNISIRDYLYAEIGHDDTTETDYAIRNETHKYISFSNGSEALYNLSNNQFEQPNLLHPSQLPLSDYDSAIKDELTAKAIEIRED